MYTSSWEASTTATYLLCIAETQELNGVVEKNLNRPESQTR